MLRPPLSMLTGGQTPCELMLQKHCQLSVSYNLACNSTGEIWLYEGKNGFVGYRGKIKTNSLALSLGYYF